MTEVRCTVHSCEFWEKGDYCGASKIWVRSNFACDEEDDLFFNPDPEFAEEPLMENERGGWSGEETAARSSYQTCCETMRPKEKGSGGERGRGCCR